MPAISPSRRSLVLSCILLLACIWTYLKRRARSAYFDVTRGIYHSPGWPIVGWGLSFDTMGKELCDLARRLQVTTLSIDVLNERWVMVMDPRAYLLVWKNKALSFEEPAETFQCDTTGMDKKIFQTHREETKRITISNTTGSKERKLAVEILTNIVRNMAQVNVGEKWQSFDLFSFVLHVIVASGIEPVVGKGIDANLIAASYPAYDDSFHLLAGGVPWWLSSTVRQGMAARDVMANHVKQRYEANQLQLSSWAQDSLQVVGYGIEQFRLFPNLVVGFAGNTGPICFWCLAHLISTPDAMNRVRMEVDALFNEMPEWRELHGSTDALEKLVEIIRTRLPLLSSAVEETLRLDGEVMTIRMAMQDTQVLDVGGKEIPVYKGERVMLFPAFPHSDERLFERPDEFIVDRFVQHGEFQLDGERLPGDVPVYSFGGSGRGPHRCPGRHIVRLEIPVIVATLLRFYDIRLSGGMAMVGEKRTKFGVRRPDGIMCDLKKRVM